MVFSFKSHVLLQQAGEWQVQMYKRDEDKLVYLWDNSDDRRGDSLSKLKARDL